MGIYRFKKSAPALLVLLCFACSLILPVTPTGAAGEEISAADLAQETIARINAMYKNGDKIDGYTAYVLTLAGEDPESEKWTRDGLTLKQEIENLVDLMDHRAGLVSYIVKTQNPDGSFGPYANSYGTRVPLQALAAVRDELMEAERQTVDASIVRAVYYYKDQYRTGRLAYDATGYDFDYRCIEALVQAGEDLAVGEWVYEGESLRKTVIEAAYAAADEAGLSAVDLAKHLIALQSVAPDSPAVETLAGAITGKQVAEGDELHFGNSIYDDVVVLYALGIAGELDAIDQDKALNYLERFKTAHKNAWGEEAGYAWGSFSPEEPDLTAQVLSVLSFFNRSDRVSQDIEGAKTYLKDIQDVDTGAIRAQYDSTFATAETLLALKNLGEEISDWVTTPGTKTMAQCLLAVDEWQDATRTEKLVRLLLGRHGATSFDNSIYSDFWAYLALAKANRLAGISNDARDYILTKQNTAAGPTCGAWMDYGFVDFMSTAQAVRVLAGLPGYEDDAEARAAVEQALLYMRGQQQDDGSVYNAPFDDPIIDTSETIITLEQLGIDPASWKNDRGLSPVSYLLDNNVLNSIYNFVNASVTLHAYLLLGDLTGGGGNPGTLPGAEENFITVGVAVQGMNKELLYEPGEVTVSKDEEGKFTALGALAATGLDYTEAGGLVTSIGGQANSGMNGWMFKVNRTIPSMPAGKTIIKEGDKVIWWYSTDYSSSGPTWDELVQLAQNPLLLNPEDKIPAGIREQNEKLPDALKASESALAALEEQDGTVDLEKLADFSRLSGLVLKVNWEAKMTAAEQARLREELARNVIDLEEEVVAPQGAVLTDAGAELALVIPAEALAEDTTIGIQKRDTASLAAEGGFALPAGCRAVSAAYRFMPDGTTFAIPVTLNLRLALPPGVNPEDLVLACYDKNSGAWEPVPAVYDAARGLLLARIKHFSDYVVFAREAERPRKSFIDVTPNAYGWAQDAIELLAGAGIIAGVDDRHFEPGRPITRAEFASLLVRVVNPDGAPGKETPFKDVKPEDWYAAAIAVAAGSGLVAGYEDGTFRPGAAITREEAAAMLTRDLELETSETNLNYKDISAISPWARKSMAAAVASGLLKGYEDGTLRPKANITRAECAVIIYRLVFGINLD